MIKVMLVVLAAGVAGSAVSAQEVRSASPPAVVSQGVGEVEIAPDRAELHVQVETRAVVAGRASEENARIVRALLDTLRAGFRLSGPELTTAAYSVRPEMVYPGDGRPPRLTGYVVTNTLRVRTQRIDRIGEIIDAAVAKGSTGVTGPAFYLAEPGEARRQALAAAVGEARRDAAIMATAAGGTLGELIELSSETSDGGMPVSMVALRAAAETTPIEARPTVVTARVVARWKFIPPAE